MVSFRGPISERAFNLTDRILLGSTTYAGIGIGIGNSLGKLDGIIDETAYLSAVSFSAYSALAYVAERGVAWVTPDHDWLGDKSRHLLDHPHRFGVRNAVKFGLFGAFTYGLTEAHVAVLQYLL